MCRVEVDFLRPRILFRARTARSYSNCTRFIGRYIDCRDQLAIELSTIEYSANIIRMDCARLEPIMEEPDIYDDHMATNEIVTLASNSVEIEDSTPIADCNALDEELAKSTTTPVNVAAKLRECYGSNITLLKHIMRIFKFAFTKPEQPSPLASLSDSDLARDIYDTKLSLPNFSGGISDILHAEQSSKLLSEQLAAVPVILDFTYMYFVGCIIPDAPLYHLPEQPLKYMLIANQLKKQIKTAAKTQKFLKTSDAFLTLIKDPVIREFRQEDPPFLVQTMRAVSEIRDLLYGQVRQKIKELLVVVTMLGWEESQNKTPPSEEPHSEKSHNEEPHSEELHSEEPPSEEPQNNIPPSEESHSEEPPSEEPQSEEPQSEESQNNTPPNINAI